ncbi:MAG: alpha/beta hydrolase-fold protein [Acidobacteriota bacterium]
MSLIIRQLKEKERLSLAEIDGFLESHTFPIVEEFTVTFVYRGRAEAVHLQHWIYGLPASQPFERLKGTDLWYLVLELPRNSRVEYKIDVASNGEREWILDPLNPLVAHDPFGANSVCHGHGYQSPGWTLPDPEARPGVIHEVSFQSQVFGQVRDLKIYLPARFRRRRRYPLLVVHDGDDYLRYAQLRTVLDNLIHRLEIPPMIVALTQPQERLKEYAAHRDQARFVALELLPFLESEFPLLPSPGARGMLGASLGAVASLFTAWRHPGLYGRLLLQSGSFLFTEIGPHHRGPEFDPVIRFVNAFREEPGCPSQRLFLSCGIYESLIYYNRSLLPLLEKTGMEVRYKEARDGHNWENWRDRLRDGLSWLFPGPLWMIYE